MLKTKLNTEVGISTLKRGGRIVAFTEGASFDATEIKTIGANFKTYLISFDAYNSTKIRATSLKNAIELAAASSARSSDGLTLCRTWRATS